VVNIISISSSRTHSSIKIDKDRYLSGNPIEVTVELRDENDKPVKEQKQQLNNAVICSGAVLVTVISPEGTLRVRAAVL
ncbi:hypothetical protein ACUOFC_60055, partial [Escherichia sp. TWPC-MK]